MFTEMRSYFAVQGNKLYQGGWLTVRDWGRRRIHISPLPVKLFTARGGDKHAQVIAEITPDGERCIQDGRLISLKTLLNGKEQ